MAVKFKGNEILSMEDLDMFTFCQGLWKMKLEKRNAVRQGIISNDGCILNCIKLRINTKDKRDGNTLDKDISHTYRNKFIIPINFRMLDSTMPYYQSGVVPDIKELKPGRDQKHICIVLLHYVNVAYVQQHFYKVLLGQVEVILSIVKAKYRNLVHPIHPCTLDSFGQAVSISH